MNKTNIYTTSVQRLFARIFDFACFELGYDVEEFGKIFLESEVVQKLEDNDYGFMLGHSGFEMVNMILGKEYEPSYSFERSTFYWLGYVLGYVWINSNYTLKQIINVISFSDLQHMYFPYHEMDISKTYEYIIDQIIKNNSIKKLRNNLNMSQSQLSLLSQIPLKTIQKYEQGELNIQKASFENVLKLSKALKCNPENLI